MMFQHSAASVFALSLRTLLLTSFLSLLICTGCHTLPRTGEFAPRKGDEIVAAGQFFHTGTPVVLWLDPGGYDAYRVERRFSPSDKSDWENSQIENKNLRTPNRYNLRVFPIQIGRAHV